MRSRLHALLNFAHRHLVVIFMLIVFAVAAGVPLYVSDRFRHDGCVSRQRLWDAASIAVEHVEYAPTNDPDLRSAEQAANEKRDDQRRRLGERPTC